MFHSSLWCIYVGSVIYYTTVIFYYTFQRCSSLGLYCEIKIALFFLLGVVEFNGFRIAGLSGIYKRYDYMKGRYESPPYDEVKNPDKYLDSLDNLRLILQFFWKERLYREVGLEPFIIDITALGRRGYQGFCDNSTKALLLKSVTRRGCQNVSKTVWSHLWTTTFIEIDMITRLENKTKL